MTKELTNALEQIAMYSKDEWASKLAYSVLAKNYKQSNSLTENGSQSVSQASDKDTKANEAKPLAPPPTISIETSPPEEDDFFRKKEEQEYPHGSMEHFE